jgi:hypothetical protein
MFWIIFDTATKRDYYRDVHNLLALPIGDTIRYDYRPQHISDEALAFADSNNARPQKALLIYAQAVSYEKGGPSPPGGEPLPLNAALWVPTRLAVVEHVTRRADRYYFSLKLAGYPRPLEDRLSLILSPLIQTQEVPFTKWIAFSDRDGELAELELGDAHENRAAIVDLLGVRPSQFAGDAFWRISKVMHGLDPPIPLIPLISDQRSPEFDQSTVLAGSAIYHVSELEHLSFEIETRTAQPAAEAEHTSASAVRFSAPPTGPLSALNEKSLSVRRYSNETIAAEISATHRIRGQSVDLKINTTPTSNDYCSGAELTMRFHIGKSRLRVWGSGLLMIFGPIALAAGTGLMPTEPTLAMSLLGLGSLALFAAYCNLTNRIPFPSSN